MGQQHRRSQHHGFGSANNGGGTDGEEFTFSNVGATAGDFIYVASETPNFVIFFGFAPGYTDSAANINGDDAIESLHERRSRRRIR